MQVTETAAAGLKREYRVVVPAIDLEAKVKERLDDLKNRVQLRGFRPGKVPVAHLKRLYGKSAMAEVIEAAVREANTKIVNDGGFMSGSTLLAIMGRMASYTGKNISWEQAQNSAEDLSPAKYEWGPAPKAEVAIPGVTRLV